jgi:Ca2+/H+ antiporter
MTFRPVEFLGYAAAVAVPALLLVRGRTSRGRGVALVIVYAAVAVVFFIAGR